MPTTDKEKQEGWLSVTQVLDAFIPKGLLDWYLKTGKKEAKRIGTIAMKIGSRVDELIQQDIKDGSYKLNSKDSIEVKNCMEAWRQFKADYEPEINAVQLEVKSEQQKLVGHIDLIIKNRIIDVKCASSIKPNYWLQVCKYARMHALNYSGILRLDKNLGTYQFMTHEQADIDFNQCVKVFDGLLEAYRFYNAPKEQEEICQTS